MGWHGDYDCSFNIASGTGHSASEVEGGLKPKLGGGKFTFAVGTYRCTVEKFSMDGKKQPPASKYSATIGIKEIDPHPTKEEVKTALESALNNLAFRLSDGEHHVKDVVVTPRIK